jgi:Tfp pilus assembly protein PilF
MVLLETGNPDDAVDTLLDVLKTDPRDPRALVILGNHYARQHGQRDTALNLIRRACEVAPDDAPRARVPRNGCDEYFVSIVA